MKDQGSQSYDGDGYVKSEDGYTISRAFSCQLCCTRILSNAKLVSSDAWGALTDLR